MPFGSVNPDDLDGEQLEAWYRRSPDDIAQARQAAAQQAYDDFFYPTPSQTQEGQGQQPTVYSNSAVEPIATSGSPYMDRSLSTPGDADLDLVGNPAHARLIREWEQKYGVDWPRDPVTGRKFDVAHYKAIADGGKHTVDNIRPMLRADHQAEHMASGDYGRWGRRPSIARAFGGQVERSLGAISVIPTIVSLLTGGVRVAPAHDLKSWTQGFTNFVSDMEGWSSPDDDRIHDEFQRAINPHWKPGDPEVI